MPDSYMSKILLDSGVTELPKQLSPGAPTRPNQLGIDPRQPMSWSPYPNKQFSPGAPKGPKQFGINQKQPMSWPIGPSESTRQRFSSAVSPGHWLWRYYQTSDAPPRLYTPLKPPLQDNEPLTRVERIRRLFNPTWWPYSPNPDEPARPLWQGIRVIDVPMLARQAESGRLLFDSIAQFYDPTGSSGKTTLSYAPTLTFYEGLGWLPYLAQKTPAPEIAGAGGIGAGRILPLKGFARLVPQVGPAVWIGLKALGEAAYVPPVFPGVRPIFISLNPNYQPEISAEQANELANTFVKRYGGFYSPSLLGIRSEHEPYELLVGRFFDITLPNIQQYANSPNDEYEAAVVRPVVYFLERTSDIDRRFGRYFPKRPIHQEKGWTALEAAGRVSSLASQGLFMRRPAARWSAAQIVFSSFKQHDPIMLLLQVAHSPEASYFWRDLLFNPAGLSFAAEVLTSIGMGMAATTTGQRVLKPVGQWLSKVPWLKGLGGVALKTLGWLGFVQLGGDLAKELAEHKYPLIQPYDITDPQSANEVGRNAAIGMAGFVGATPLAQLVGYLEYLTGFHVTPPIDPKRPDSRLIMAPGELGSLTFVVHHAFNDEKFHEELSKRLKIRNGPLTLRLSDGQLIEIADDEKAPLLTYINATKRLKNYINDSLITQRALLLQLRQELADLMKWDAKTVDHILMDPSLLLSDLYQQQVNPKLSRLRMESGYRLLKHLKDTDELYNTIVDIRNFSTFSQQQLSWRFFGDLEIRMGPEDVRDLRSTLAAGYDELGKIVTDLANAQRQLLHVWAQKQPQTPEILALLKFMDARQVWIDQSLQSWAGFMNDLWYTRPRLNGDGLKNWCGLRLLVAEPFGPPVHYKLPETG